MRRALIAVMAVFAVFAGGPAGAYSGGPTFIVTDLTTTCASCHEKFKLADMAIKASMATVFPEPAEFSKLFAAIYQSGVCFGSFATAARASIAF